MADIISVIYSKIFYPNFALLNMNKLSTVNWIIIIKYFKCLNEKKI